MPSAILIGAADIPLSLTPLPHTAIIIFPLAPSLAFGLQAVAAVLQQDTSAIVTLKSSGIDRPAKLDGKR